MNSAMRVSPSARAVSLLGGLLISLALLALLPWLQAERSRHRARHLDADVALNVPLAVPLAAAPASQATRQDTPGTRLPPAAPQPPPPPLPLAAPPVPELALAPPVPSPTLTLAMPTTSELAQLAPPAVPPTTAEQAGAAPSTQEGEMTTATETGAGQTAGRGGPYELADVDAGPRALANPAPRYPFSARRQGLEGSVLVRFTVTSGGRVEDAVVVEAEPEGVFEEAALTAVRSWRFTPARREGENAPVRVLLPITFSLE